MVPDYPFSYKHSGVFELHQVKYREPDTPRVPSVRRAAFSRRIREDGSIPCWFSKNTRHGHLEVDTLMIVKAFFPQFFHSIMWLGWTPRHVGVFEAGIPIWLSIRLPMRSYLDSVFVRKIHIEPLLDF
jgi:hypothetical protein